MKPVIFVFFPRGLLVAPRAGAWIETLNIIKSPIYLKVAPRAGAWIETMILLRRIAIL